MKILELRFKNINSLYGEWCIDFTHPDYETNGLFAITGATGSGKTTILDALCLALYAETPRLSRINQSQNEVMSRQTGECYSEVLFETAKGTFRAHWHQQRARKKTDGALQAPKREIADEQGVVLATKLREVQDKVDAVMGMGFDRFTRSILLAQGNFDSFLKANADERSPILEQITGTEIYTEISKLVHLRNSTENQTLTELMAGLDGIQVLNEDALEQIRFDLKQIQNQHKEEAQKRDAAKAALDCKERIQSLEQALHDNHAEQALLRADHEAFKPDAKRLTDARCAQPLAVDYTKLITLRHDRSKITTELKTATQELPTLEERQTNATAVFEATDKLLKEKESVQKELLPVLTKTRVFDTQITGQSATQKTEKAALEQLQSEQRALHEKEASNKTELEELQLQYNKTETYQKEHAQDAELTGQLSAIFQSLEQLKKQTEENEAAKKIAKAAVTTAEKANKAAIKETGNLLVTQQRFTEAETARETIIKQLAPLLLDGIDWRAQLEELRQRIKIEQRMVVTREALTANSTEAAEAGNELIQKNSEQESLQREHALLIENLRLQQKIKGLEEERAALTDGQPCPLCGSLEHPYAVELPIATTNSLDKIADALVALAKRIIALTEKQATAKTLSKTLQASLKDDETELNTLVPGTAEKAEEIAQRIKQIETLEQREKEAKVLQDAARETLSQQTLFEQTAKQRAESTAEKSADTKARSVKAKLDLDAIQTQLEKAIEPFGMALSPETATQLTTRRDQWIEAEQKMTALKQTRSTLETTLTNRTELIAQNEIRIQRQTEAWATTQSVINVLKAEREALFGERHPDIVEQEIQTEIDAARKKSNDAQTQLSDYKEALSIARQNVHALEKRKQETQTQLDETSPLFSTAMAHAGFDNEDTYLSARLDEPEYAKLETRENELKHRHTHLTALEAEKTKQLQHEREQKHIETSPEEHAALAERCNELQQQIGTFNGQLKQNQLAIELHRSKLGGIEKQQIECARWNTLHTLIGSADGKKFRNFAQGLTFELMVSHANQQLAKMSNRYLLVRDKQQPLDLNVVDNYQAGEIRPVRNLSGGESFVVSLSLALGLSRMASKHIRVDSLFLDEGFGTLDEDALEIALEALAELKQDGKLIGVISHVGALKERIGTQINVQSASGGRSQLEGTGVSATISS